MVFFDALMRFAAGGLLAALFVLLLRDARGTAIARVGALVCVTHLAQAIFSAPEPIAPPAEIALASAFVAVPAPALLWLFWIMLLDDQETVRAHHVVIVAGASLLKFGWALEYAGLSLPLHSLRYAGTYLIGAVLMGHILYRAIAGWRDDMIEARRLARLVVALVVTGAGALNLLAELSELPQSVALNLGHALALVSLFSIVWWLLSLNPALITASSPRASGARNIPARDVPAYERLMAVLEHEKVYLNADLTIGRLSGQVGVPEHQLRALINQAMGHRNFASFINGYRLEYAKALLADPSRVRVPVLTIAFDSGFQTLSTFNRAFRRYVGETPSDFRKRVIGERPAVS